jgi:hypothetical protein
MAHEQAIRSEPSPGAFNPHHPLHIMPIESTSVPDDWWIARQFKEAELRARAERLQQQREGAEAIWALIDKLGLTEEDLREMFPPNEQPTGG